MNQPQFAHIRLGDDVTQLYRPEMRFTTAHASAEGYVMLTCIITGRGSKCELAAVSRYDGTPAFLDGSKAVAVIDDSEEPEEDYDSFREAAQAMGSFRAFGSESSFSELAAERINYNIRAEELGWATEILDFKDGRKLRAPVELRGYREVHNPSGVKGDLFEPATHEEALGFVTRLLGDKGVTVEEAHKNTHWVQSNLTQALERTEAALEMCTLEDLVTYLKTDDFSISEHDYKRLRASCERGNIGGSWCHESPYGIGEREGVTVEQARQNDLLYNKGDQHHLPGERVDGKLLFSQELEVSRATSLFDLMYDRSKKGPDGAPAVRSWSEQSLYLRRCANERNERFAKKLWHILTWPMEILDELMPKLRAQYKASVRANSPGPKRERVNGRWVNAPLRGPEALAHIRANPGTLKGSRVSKNLTVHIGHTWHKLLLTKKHMDELEETYRWRQGRVTLSIGEKLVEERIAPPIKGLPVSYVAKKYARKHN